MLRKNKGQSVLEYAMIIAVVVAALIAIQHYMKKSLQGRLRASTDQIGDQFEANSTFNNQWKNIGGQAKADKDLTTLTHETRIEDSRGGILSNVTSSERMERVETDKWGNQVQ